MERPFARQSFPLALRTSMGTQGGSLVGDHAWETSFGESDRNDRQNTSHFSNPSSPKTIALFMKRSTKALIQCTTPPGELVICGLAPPPDGASLPRAAARV